MSALDDFTALIQETETIKQVIRSLKEEPAYLLDSICRQYEKTGRPVPDPQLNITGYLGEVSLKALFAAGLISQQPGGRLSLYCYEPTQNGLEQYRNLKDNDSLARSD